MITETEEVAAALDAAAKRWPADRGSRTRLLLRLIHEGHLNLRSDEERRRAEWLAIVDQTSGTFDYGAGYLEELREDWPA